MQILKLKQTDDLIKQAGGSAAVVCCHGCNELLLPQADISEMSNKLCEAMTVSAQITITHMCNPEITKLFIKEYNDQLENSDSVLVIACGVGVQEFSEQLFSRTEDMVSGTCNTVNDRVLKVIAACDTYPLPGFQGLTPSNYDCALCGQCRLNDTAGICPVTSCSKSLINGQCGGAENGMCEVDKNMQCGWERINERLSKPGYIISGG